MSWLHKLLTELKENLDVDLILALGITVGIASVLLNVFGKANVPLLISLTLTLLGVLAFSQRRDRHIDEQIKKTLHELSRVIDSVNLNQAFEQQIDAYNYLVRVINEQGAKNAVLIQYSGNFAMPVIQALLRKGAHVTVYLQHEETAEKDIGSNEQAQRVKSMCNNMPGILGSCYDPNRLKVYKYRTPGTVNGIKIDNQVLCIGWYTYEQQVDMVQYRQPRQNRKTAQPDRVEISGHDVGAVVVWNGTREFYALDKTFERMINNYRKFAEEVIFP